MTLHDALIENIRQQTGDMRILIMGCVDADFSTKIDACKVPGMYNARDEFTVADMLRWYEQSPKEE